MKKQKLFIHVGDHKTGTSFLQSVLGRNNTKLYSQGFYYFGGEHLGQRKKVIRSLCAPSNSSYILRLKNYIVASVEWRRLVGGLRKSPLLTGIIIEENFQHIRSKRVFKRIAKNFDVKIVMYLRRQDHLVQSKYNQAVKEQYVRYQYPISDYVQCHLYSYKKRIKSWERAFGKENLIIRVYEDLQLQNGLLADFSKVVGFSHEGFEIKKKRANVSLSPQALEFVRLLHTNNIPYYCYLTVLDELKLINEEAVKSRSQQEQVSIMPPMMASFLVEKYAEENAYIAKTYLGREDGRLFYENPPDKSIPWTNPMAVSAEVLVEEVVMPLIVRLNNEITVLQRRLKRAVKKNEKAQKA